jgi:hypothetical protein
MENTRVAWISRESKDYSYGTDLLCEHLWLSMDLFHHSQHSDGSLEADHAQPDSYWEHPSFFANAPSTLALRGPFAATFSRDKLFPSFRFTSSESVVGMRYSWKF